MLEDDKNINEESIGYNCPECSSLIEINNINEKNNTIEFKCLNKNNILLLSIDDYLEKMKNKCNFETNNDICKNHNSKYISYCFDCNNHVCEECLKTRDHIHHNKNYIIEIQPTNGECLIYSKIIEYYNNEINKLQDENKTKLMELKNNLNYNSNRLFQLKEKNLKLNGINKQKELKRNEKQYINDLNQIIKKYEEEIIKRKNKYYLNKNVIINKYKLREIKQYLIYKNAIFKINKKYNDDLNNMEYTKILKKMSNTKNFISKIYNTYINNKNNYYNCINMNNIKLY